MSYLLKLLNKVSSVCYKKYMGFISNVKKDIINTPYESVYVPTKLITDHVVNNKKHLKSYRTKKFYAFNIRIVGKILDGEWDNEKIPFKGTTAYISFYQKFIENKSWEKTAYFEKFIQDLNQKGHCRGVSEWEEFKKNFLYKWENTYKEIINNGYKTQRQMQKSSENEIEVCISQDGEILFVDGRHRLAMAKLAGVEYVPVIVNIWHKKIIDEVKTKTEHKNITPIIAIQYILKK